MRSTTAIAILALALPCQSLFAQSDARSKPPAATAIQPSTQLRIEAPRLGLKANLPSNKRLELMNRALADFKVPPIPKPPVSATRVSAKVPASPAGAHVLQADSLTYVSSAADDPDGYFVFGPATANGGGGMIKLSFPVEKGKLYLLECKVRSIGNVPIMFSREIGAPVTETITPVDDHVFVAVRATSDYLVRVLQSNARTWWWSACDISPVG
jgi:hypothetical protein